MHPLQVGEHLRVALERSAHPLQGHTTAAVAAAALPLLDNGGDATALATPYSRTMPFSVIDFNFHGCSDTPSTLLNRHVYRKAR